MRAVLTGRLPGAKDRDRFLPAEVTVRDGQIQVDPILPAGSHDVAASARGTALVRIHAGAEPSEPGAPCEILPLSGWPLS